MNITCPPNFHWIFGGTVSQCASKHFEYEKQICYAPFVLIHRIHSFLQAPMVVLIPGKRRVIHPSTRTTLTGEKDAPLLIILQGSPLPLRLPLLPCLVEQGCGRDVFYWLWPTVSAGCGTRGICTRALDNKEYLAACWRSLEEIVLKQKIIGRTQS